MDAGPCLDSIPRANRVILLPLVLPLFSESPGRLILGNPYPYPRMLMRYRGVCERACSASFLVMRPSEKDVERWLRSAAWKAEDTLPTSQKKSGDCLSRTSRPKNGVDVRGYTVLARSLMPSSTS